MGYVLSPVEPAEVVPVDVFRDGDLEVVNPRPRALVADQLGLEEGIERLGHRLVIAITLCSDGGDRFDLGEPLGVADVPVPDAVSEWWTSWETSRPARCRVEPHFQGVQGQVGVHGGGWLPAATTRREKTSSTKAA